MANGSEKDFQERAGGGSGEAFDWRSDAEASLERHDADKAERRRGRPKGSGNRKTAAFADWYQEKGFKDPLEAQAEFLSADPVALQAWFAEHERTLKAIGKATGLAVPALVDIVKEQMSCARDLAPYLHGKAKVREDDPDQRLPVLILNLGTNQLDQAQQVATQKGLSLGRPLVIDASNINGLAGATIESLTGESLTKDKGE
ncbi:MAG: hypothetical protein ACK4M8_02180 [Allorhizobium sp.]